MPDGTCETVASWDNPATAGPNGLAVGPDGAVYICNSGGFAWHEYQGVWLPALPGTGVGQSAEYITGSIERLDLDTGEVKVLYTACGGHRLCGPNDLVFDADGGLWFTDRGKTRDDEVDRVGVFYARIDGSFSERVIFPLIGPNGIGLSPDGGTLHVADTPTGRLWAWEMTGPGEVDHRSRRCVANTLGHFDSLGVEADGTVVVAALNDGLCVVRPDGDISYVRVPGPTPRRRRRGRLPPDAKLTGHEHLLGRRGHDHRLRHRCGREQAHGLRVAPARSAAGLQPLDGSAPCL